MYRFVVFLLVSCVVNRQFAGAARHVQDGRPKDEHSEKQTHTDDFVDGDEDYEDYFKNMGLQSSNKMIGVQRDPDKGIFHTEDGKDMKDAVHGYQNSTPQSERQLFSDLLSKFQSLFRLGRPTIISPPETRLSEEDPWNFYGDSTDTDPWVNSETGPWTGSNFFSWLCPEPDYVYEPETEPGPTTTPEPEPEPEPEYEYESEPETECEYEDEYEYGPEDEYEDEYEYGPEDEYENEYEYEYEYEHETTTKPGSYQVTTEPGSSEEIEPGCLPVTEPESSEETEPGSYQVTTEPGSSSESESSEETEPGSYQVTTEPGSSSGSESESSEEPESESSEESESESCEEPESNTESESESSEETEPGSYQVTTEPGSSSGSESESSEETEPGSYQVTTEPGSSSESESESSEEPGSESCEEPESYTESESESSEETEPGSYQVTTEPGSSSGSESESSEEPESESYPETSPGYYPETSSVTYPETGPIICPDPWIGPWLHPGWNPVPDPWLGAWTHPGSKPPTGPWTGTSHWSHLWTSHWTGSWSHTASNPVTVPWTGPWTYPGYGSGAGFGTHIAEKLSILYLMDKSLYGHFRAIVENLISILEMKTCLRFVEDRKRPSIVIYSERSCESRLEGNAFIIGEHCFDSMGLINSIFDMGQICDKLNVTSNYELGIRSAATSGTPKCMDRLKNCEVWAKSGGCFSFFSVMSTACPRSCNLCGDTCVDYSRKCGKAVDNDTVLDCMINYREKKLSCARTCGMCTTPGDECIDLGEDCRPLVAKGYCAKYPDRMEEICARSCGFCKPARCVNKRRDCSKLKRMGACEMVPGLMQKYCSKACKFCGGRQNSRNSDELKQGYVCRPDKEFLLTYCPSLPYPLIPYH